MYDLTFSKSSIYIFFFLLFLSIIGCKKKEEIDNSTDNSLIVNSFHIEKKNNPHLKEDIVFDIKGNNIFGKLKSYHYELIPTFTTNATTVEISTQVQSSGVSKVDFRKTIFYTLVSAEGKKKVYSVIITWDDSLPQINIVTKDGAPITSRNIYVKAEMSINGQGIYDDYKNTCQIRGRGNTTWTFPKKPYKIKLDDNTPLLGMKAEKDWILLANYLDGMHSLNAVAMKIGQLMNMPFTNNIVPVEVVLNGQYQGCYMLTEQIEVKKNRVSIGNDGILLQMDKNFDDPWQFKSTFYQLPVMIMYPELTASEQIAPIKAEFEKLETLVAESNFPNNNYTDYVDIESVANYFIVYMLTNNEELNHPKSTYLYKTKVGKWTMGPIWDFDWAFAFEGTQTYFARPDRSMFWNSSSAGTKFFVRFMADPRIKTLIKQKWEDFKNNRFNHLYSFIDDYTFTIEGARNRDYQKWRRGSNNFQNDIANLKVWLQNRTNYMNTFIGGL